MISSLRRNLQREHLDRLVDLTLPSRVPGAAQKPVSNLAQSELRTIQDLLKTAQESAGARMDPYTKAHLTEAQELIKRALDAQLIYNVNAFTPSGGTTRIIIGDESRKDSPAR